MTDRVRLLLEDGTVLAEGVRPEARYSRAVALENRKRAAEGEWWSRIMDGDDCYDIEWRGPAESIEQTKTQFDAFEAAMQKLGMRMHELYYSGYNAVIKL